ncbi:SusC/RagA family TonB-linked outer membrane protein [Pedobacter nutrimenti]|uniref:SusC/RagA family TonB-linked outer membrane protein n=1 Tax=Pedobacter nutrimenti TaxID=1241337 RepID=UPI00292E9F7E|nr:SusC/RagA family TonB-linked outer membrane protein [Pedobacter nutrimenti]
MNFYFKSLCKPPAGVAKILLVMKLTIVLLTAGFLQLSASTYSQSVTLKKKKATLVSVFKEIRKQTGYDFVYSDRMMDNAGLIDVDFNNISVIEALNKAFSDQPFLYEIDKKTIVVKAMPIVQQQRIVTGKVTDDNGDILVGVSVKNQKSNIVTKTDKDGKYAIRIVDNTDALTFSYIGYEPKTIQVSSKNVVNVELKSRTSSLNDVVVTGTGIDRKKDSFTGAAATFSGAELKAIGNNNIIASLKSLDPSFLQIDNDLKGSNPNVLPTLELRGKTTVSQLSLKDQFGTDPNQPLFILDGFETTLQVIIDLDMNRVASVIILKDAASTALYGSKAANGVIVVETVKPVPGKLRFSYTNDLRIDAPDLTVYNMMNSTEKLEFERLSGRYKIDDPLQQIVLDSIYNKNKAAIARGVDTYWLAEPLRNVISENHSINASGGDEVFRYGVNFNYKTNPGVMKGSARNSWGGNINMIYRKGKFNINNSFSVNGQQSSESPYGNFSDFVNANPYYEKSTTNPFLDQTKTFSSVLTTTGLNVSNPLYNASLPSKNASNGMTITNNLSVQYNILPKLRLNGGLSLSKGSNQTDVFISPDNTTQLSLIPTLRGTYTSSKSQNFSYTTNALLTYGNVMGKHSITANLRGQMSNNESNSQSFVAQGFPTGTGPILGFAYGYANNGIPTSNVSAFRSMNFTGSANYSYASRYLLDASYRLDGSTSFGHNDPWSPYWSTGIGWNVHKESFLKDSKIINRIKLYTNIGVTGNQTMGTSVSTSIYQYLKAYNQAGLGINLLTLGNSNLLPTKTTQLSSGVDFGLFGNRLSGAVNVYTKTTNNQIVSVAYPTSSGVSSYSFNAGKMITTGYELNLSVLVLSNVARRISWRVGITGASSDGKYENFGTALAKLNAQSISSGSLSRFQDGASPNDLFTVRSLGIDPATGREMFLMANGEHTLDYAQADMPKVGSSKPLLEGVLSNQVSFKNLSLSIMMRYRAKADVFNQALLSKVENISWNDIVNNQDKRALYDRWKNPGDISQFKSISLTDVTGMSTRFLQEENTLSLESVSLSYMFSNQKWMKTMGLENLSLSGYTNDIFRFSTVKRERGIEYPYARSVAFTLRASF